MRNTPQDREESYVAVIFSSTRRAVRATGAPGANGPVDDEYEATADAMAALGAQQPGFIGLESARNPDGTGITVSYWRTEADAIAWKAVAEHLVAQRRGQQEWYSQYTTRVATVHREYSYRADAVD